MASGIFKLTKDWCGLRVYSHQLYSALDEVDLCSLFYTLFNKCAGLFPERGVLFQSDSMIFDSRKVEKDLNAKYKIRLYDSQLDDNFRQAYYFVPREEFFCTYSKFASDGWSSFVLLDQVDESLLTRLSNESFDYLQLILAADAKSFFYNYDGVYWAYFGNKSRRVSECIRQNGIEDIGEVVGVKFFDTLRLHQWGATYGIDMDTGINKGTHD